MHCGGARLQTRLGLFRPTKDGADKPSRVAKLGRVFARLVVAVRFALWRPATSPVHATHGPAPNGGRPAPLPGGIAPLAKPRGHRARSGGVKPGRRTARAQEIRPWPGLARALEAPAFTWARVGAAVTRRGSWGQPRGPRRWMAGPGSDALLRQERLVA